MEQKTKITFELKSPTEVTIIRDGKNIGRVWSQCSDGLLILPYPHNDTPYCKHLVQICGFDESSPIWACGPYEGKKDLVIRFIPTEDEYFKEKMKKYEEYVESFFETKLNEQKVGIDEIRYVEVDFTKDLSELKNFADWVKHQI